mmetsp:Transcript_24823/g.40969  ORF Transcript_24823/g.40969 Transcript_24823/m.40969 type:complete len:202 (-) Transcript_24823:2135-2740(-)
MNYEPLRVELRTISPSTYSRPTISAGINLQTHFLLMQYMLYHRIVMESRGWHCVIRRSSGGESDLRFGERFVCMRSGVLGRCFWPGHEGNTPMQGNWHHYTSKMEYLSTLHLLDMHIIHCHGRWVWRLRHNNNLIMEIKVMLVVEKVSILRGRRKRMILLTNSISADTTMKTNLISSRHPCSLTWRKSAYIGKKKKEQIIQ